MTAAPCDCDDGPDRPRRCFPARAFHRPGKDGGGHWLVARRKAEEQKYSNVYRRIKEDHKKTKNRAVARGHILDGPFLLQLHCVDKPSELSSVDISEQKLNTVKPEDLKAFDNVVYINASVNALSLDSFSSFVSLRELCLCVNGICNMTFDSSHFPYLEVLDLSYNSLSADDIVSIGRLPHLRVLHLTGNQLRYLPPNLGSSNCDHIPLPAKEEKRFGALEILMLDDNKLSSRVFNSVRNLNRLKHLNLQGNRISEIPHLPPTGCSKPVQTSSEKLPEEEGPAHTEPDPEHDENFKRVLQDNLEKYCKGSGLPLPELQFLNLSDNKIAEEEALIALTLFPVLREIDIHSNPLTTQRRDLPLLTYYLHEKLGIKIKRKKIQEVVKPPLKVEKQISKVPKKPMLRDATCPAQREEDKSSRSNTVQENTELFFVTQTADVCEYEFDLQADEKEAAVKEERKENDTMPEKFHCYKMLMDAKPNPEAAKAVGIQTAVRMLEHTLKNLNVYRDSKPKLDSIQMPYREKEKRIKELPPLKPIKKPTERVDEVLKEMKESTTITRVALSSALRNTGVKRHDYKEALLLLRDMETKYKMVHKKTMDQVASIESDRNGNLNEGQPPAAWML